MVKLNVRSEFVSDRNAVDLAQDINDAYEGLMLVCKELDAADAQMDAIQASIDLINNVGGVEAIRSVNMDGGLEDLLGIPESKITAEAALEGLGEQARAAWEWFCKKVRQFWNWLCSLFGKKSEDLEAKADKLASTAQKAAEAVAAVKNPEAEKFNKENSVPAFDDIDVLCIMTGIMCDSVATKGSESLTSVKENGGTEAAASILGKFSTGAEAAYKPIVAQRPAGAKIMTEHFEGEDKWSYKVLDVDFSKFLPEGKTSSYWTVGWTESNLRKVQNAAAQLRKAGKKCRELSGKLQHKTDASESALKSITDAEKQAEARKVVQVIRIIAKQLLFSETVAGKTAGYHIECNNKVNRVAAEVTRIVTSK